MLDLAVLLKELLDSSLWGSTGGLEALDEDFQVFSLISVFFGLSLV